MTREQWLAVLKTQRLILSECNDFESWKAQELRLIDLLITEQEKKNDINSAVQKFLFGNT